MPPGAGISERILVCPFQLVVADTAAGVLESLSFLGDEFPGVFPRSEHQFSTRDFPLSFARPCIRASLSPIEQLGYHVA